MPNIPTRNWVGLRISQGDRHILARFRVAHVEAYLGQVSRQPFSKIIEVGLTHVSPQHGKAL